MEWNEDFSVSDEIIDAQHKKLFILFNEISELVFHNNDPQNLMAIVDELSDYTVYHFSEEETRMKAVNFPYYEDHYKEHQNFIKKTVQFRDALLANDLSVAEDIFLFLNKWLVMHIKVEDQKYMPFIKDTNL